MGTEPDRPTLKKLFALTGNVCAFQSLDDRRGCETEIARPDWPCTQGEVAHIRGAKPGSARYDESMSDAERAAFENLIVLCPTHHHFVDEIERDRYTVDVLTTMKDRHERNAGSDWASAAELERYATLVLVRQFGIVTPAGLGTRDVARADDSNSLGTRVDSDGRTRVDSDGDTRVTSSRAMRAPEAGYPIIGLHPPAQDGELKGLRGEAEFGDVTFGDVPAVESDSPGGGKSYLLLEDGGQILTEGGAPIRLEGDPPG